MAKQWVNVAELEGGGVGSGELDTPIPDASVDGHSTTITSSITLEKSIGFTEFVEVNVSLRHQSFRDLEIELVSPSGAVSRLSVPHDTYSDIFSFIDFVPMYGSFRFGSARHLGEDPNGDWTLRVTDRIHARDGILESWNISIYGHEPKPDAPTVESLTPGPGSLTVVWTAPAQTSDFEVTSYDLTYIQTDAKDAEVAVWRLREGVKASSVGGNLEYTVSGLTGDTQYDVQVRAVNQWGASDWSVVATGTPENALPRFIEGSTTTRNVMENTPAGEKVGAPVKAFDDDTLTYTLSGSDAATFDIDGETGQITVGASTTLDFESGVTEYSVEVAATDLSLASATIKVAISVTDVSLGETGDRYDADSNEVIHRDEVILAIQDYLDGLITRDEVIAVIRLYLGF